MFASTGTVTGALCGMDMFGSCMIGCMTALGGGTIRDGVFLGRKAFWCEEPEYLVIAGGAAIATFVAWPEVMKLQEENKLRQNSKELPRAKSSSSHTNPFKTRDNLDLTIDTLDALGLGAFAIIGVQNGLRLSCPPLACILLGISTATFGGVTRDIACARPVRIMHSNAEVYALAAALGGTSYLVARKMGGSPFVKIGVGMAVAMGIRAAALEWDIKLPVWEEAVHAREGTKDGMGVAVRKDFIKKQ